MLDVPPSVDVVSVVGAGETTLYIIVKLIDCILIFLAIASFVVAEGIFVRVQRRIHTCIASCVVVPVHEWHVLYSPYWLPPLEFSRLSEWPGER
jgi:hypothetical protein